MTRRNVVFIAGPYTGGRFHGASSYLAIADSISNARAAMAMLVEYGYGVFCPHMHSAHFETILPRVPADYWYDLDMYFLQHCDAVLRLPGYSPGADLEVATAREMGMPVFEHPDALLRDLDVWRKDK